MLARTYHCLAKKAKQPLITGLMALIIAMTNVGVDPSQAAINTSPIGSGFTVTAADLAFILKQIKIAEFHAANTTSTTGLCGALVGPGPNQLPNTLVSFGLRTVDGVCNNLESGQETFGASDQAFPRLTTPVFNRLAESVPAGFPGSGNSTNYNQTTGFVFDSQPRMISNLIVDQTSTNPAAIEVAGFPFRTQGNEGVVPCATVPGSDPPVDIVPATPVGCVPAFQTLFIPNVTTDVGLSPPFNSLFTIFGQFFDHGLDKITNGGAGTVFVPLKADDPLVAGPDHIFGNADDLSPNLRFMTVTRGTILNGPDGIRSAPNTDTPFVDQSQTYTSHSSHQVFMRKYGNTSGLPVATGKFLTETDGGIATWKTVKTQAALVLGLQLVDTDVTNIPLIAADQYGNFIPGPARGLPQYVTSSGTGLVEGDRVNPVAAPADVIRINTAFLNDIAHSAGPGSITAPKTPDGDTTAGGSLDPVATGEYDDELLDLHFICGDGRCNENIALTAIHQIFHLEHDRLVDDISTTLAANPSLQTAYQTVNLVSGPDKTFAYGERLFQAARFVNEMEYQHLVFEEFARKVQPAINPFQPFAFNQTDLNPAIKAEFAHAVYRFGHSMLTETLPRINSVVGVPLHNDIELFDGFLNPAAFFDSGNSSIKLTSQQATGSLIMGLSDQVGNEIDEFVTDTIRNRLLGLPLDLPSINIARARSEGIPSLNNVRKQIFAATNDGQLTPYTNWIDFDQALKHHASLLNFIAAYGKHPSILAATTLAGKRIAADQILNGTTLLGPDNVLGTDCGTVTATPACADDIFAPTDSADFVFSTGAWANDGSGVSKTGLDDVDLWVGGLAENTNLFGGLLGPTFNYVFEKQLTDLQNGDRFYYLARTPGMNLRAQLEGNSFAELVLRNTSPYTYTLKADSFATADCKFENANLTWPAVAGSFITGPGSVNDDPTTECNENRLLLREPNGRIQYRAVNSVDPLGINGQSVYNGTDFADAFFGGNDNDTFWGGLGDDSIEGGAGDDVALGGEGDDIITDFGGSDILKGGPGNDALDGGIGDDLILGGDGKDFTNGGANINETFSGEGDDFAIAGQGADAVFGDSGDDWEEGGDQPDLLIGDSSTLFFDDHNLPGHDILIGQGGDDDYDMEGGDDIGVAGPGVEKNAGASGYDWSIGLGDPQPQNADLDLAIVNAPPANEVRDRFNEVEALSGWKFNDTLRGDSVVPSQVGGSGFIGCDALDQAGLDRIAGLDALVPPLTIPLATVTANSVTNFCLLTGNVWGEGNILLGGAGSDTLEGRGADDILDGDKYLNVRLSVRDGGTVDVNGVFAVRDGSGAEIGSTGLMENAVVTGNFGPGTTGMTLQQAVFARKVNSGNIVAVREILLPAPVPADCGAVTPLNCDKALFSGPSAGYTITPNGDGSVTVRDNSTVPRDGTDTLWNMEQLSFCATPGAVKGTCDVREALISIVPAAVVSPASLAFGSQGVNTTAVRTITVSNTGIANLLVTGVTLAGADASLFQIASNTCTTVALGVPCTVTVSFTPTSIGLKSASVAIAHNAAGSPSMVSVTGTGTVVVAPIAGVSPTSLNFGSVRVGSASTLPAVILSNTGTAPLTISGIEVTGGSGAVFTRVTGGAGDCGASVAAGAQCAITVRFAPTTGGAKTGILTVTDNSGNVPVSTQTVVLSGTATIVANNDARTVRASTDTEAINFAVRANDAPANVGAVTIASSSFTNGGAIARVAVSATNQVTWTLTPKSGGGSDRRASKSGTYRVTYTLTNGTATAQATYTLTVTED